MLRAGCVALGVALAGCGGHPEPRTDPAADSVIQYHQHANRAGLYIAPALTTGAAANLHIDTSFTAKVLGPTLAQPLYVQKGPQGMAAFIVATEQNVVYAFDADSGSVLWQTPPLGEPVQRADLPCGNIVPLGITGTPYIDVSSRSIYLDAMTTPDGGATKKHLVFALSLDNGSVRPGWPLDVSTKVSFKGVRFDSAVQNQRGALAMVGDVLYVPYGGHAGDCGDYRGWVVGIPVRHPSALRAWATPGIKGGIWGPSGISSDGRSVFATTGNTNGAKTWSGGEAVLRFGKGPVFSGEATDYFAPANWLHLDARDQDLGGSGALLIDLPGAEPSKLLVALGKDGYAYLLDRNNLGGIGGQIAEALVSTGPIIGGVAAYRNAGDVLVAFRIANAGHGLGCPSTAGSLAAIRISPGNPPSIKVAWCADATSPSSPIVTTTDGEADPIVWDASVSRLFGFDGITGQTLFDGGGASDKMSAVHHLQTPIVAGNRIIVSANDQLFAFTP